MTMTSILVLLVVLCGLVSLVGVIISLVLFTVVIERLKPFAAVDTTLTRIETNIANLQRDMTQLNEISTMDSMMGGGQVIAMGSIEEMMEKINNEDMPHVSEDDLKTLRAFFENLLNNEKKNQNDEPDEPWSK